MAVACCGCVIEDDYGTSTVIGSGDTDDEFAVSQVDPAFSRPLVRVTQVSQVITRDAAAVAVSFASEIFDTAAMWAIGNPTRIIFPIAGLYLVGANTDWGQNTDSELTKTIFRINGITTVYSSEYQLATTGGTTNSFTDSVYQVQVNTNDYLEVILSYVGGVNATATTVTTAWACYMGKKI